MDGKSTCSGSNVGHDTCGFLQLFASFNEDMAKNCLFQWAGDFQEPAQGVLPRALVPQSWSSLRSLPQDQR